MKNKKTVPAVLRKHIKFENGKIVALPTLPFYLKPYFKIFIKEFEKISDRK